MSDPARNYCFTYNNYPNPLDDFNAKLTELCTYAIYGIETGESGTPHLQGYLQLKLKKRLASLAKSLAGCHLEVARGGYDANFKYCSKDGNTWEFGTPATAGKRKGLSDACQLVVEKKTLSEVAEQLPETYCRYYRGLEALSCALTRPRDFKTEIYWFWGPTGSGKSRRALDVETDRGVSPYYKPGSTKWWNGYNGHESVIIDDYRRDLCTFAELLRLFDRYPHSVETKGGIQSFVSRRLYITTPRPPTETWLGRTEEDLAQLLRRIEHVVEFKVPIEYSNFSVIYPDTNPNFI